eukprot:506933-Pleurochrysis_carterae.AAC.1
MHERIRKCNLRFRNSADVERLTPTARTGRRVRTSRRLACDGFENRIHHLPINRVYHFRGKMKRFDSSGVSGGGRGTEPGAVDKEAEAEVAVAAGAALAPESA